MTRKEPFGPRGLERRRSPRIPIADLEGAVGVVGAKLVSVSLYGMMIDSPVPLERDSVLSLRLVVRGPGPAPGSARTRGWPPACGRSARA